MFRTSDYPMADILRRINNQFAHVKAMREAAWNADGPIQWAKLKRLALRHARFMRHKLRSRLWRGACAMADVWHCQRRVRFLVNRQATPLPPVIPSTRVTDSEEEAHDPLGDQLWSPASTSRQWLAQTADNDITPNGTPPVAPGISQMDLEDAPWANSPEESEESEPPGGFVTSETGSWPAQTPDGRPGSSGDDSRCSPRPVPEDTNPRSPVPRDWAEQLGFDSSDYPRGFRTEDGDLGDLDE
jgi:hypothetical protein